MIRISAPAAKRKARIEIIPLIDIVFFLLATFVMVSLSMVKNQGMTVNLPQSRTAAAIDRTETFTLTVDRDGVFYLEKEKIPADALKSRLERLHREFPASGVIVNGDDAATFGAAIHALDEIRRAGIQKVSIQTRRAEG
jgi:biopolymer transport protein ExbD